MQLKQFKPSNIYHKSGKDFTRRESVHPLLTCNPSLKGVLLQELHILLDLDPQDLTFYITLNWQGFHFSEVKFDDFFIRSIRLKIWILSMISMVE